MFCPERRATSVKCQKLAANKAKFSMENRRGGNEPLIQQSGREKINNIAFCSTKTNCVNQVKKPVV